MNPGTEQWLADTRDTQELTAVAERLGREARATDCEGCKTRLSTRRQDVQGILAKLDKARAA